MGFLVIFLILFGIGCVLGLVIGSIIGFSNLIKAFKIGWKSAPTPQFEKLETATDNLISRIDRSTQIIDDKSQQFSKNLETGINSFTSKIDRSSERINAYNERWRQRRREKRQQ